MARQMLVIVLATCLAVVFVFGCSSDDKKSTGPDNVGGTGGGTGLPDFSSMVVPIPAAMQTAAGSNAGAANAVGLITMANSFAAYGGWMTPGGIPKVGGTQDGSPYIWTVGDLTITLTVTEVDTYLTWTVTLNGSDGDQTYEDFVLVRGNTEASGSGGVLSLYAPLTGDQEIISWSWLTGETGIFSIDYFVYDGGTSVTVEANPDGSGVVIHRVETNSVYTASWNPNGSGSYNYYDAQGYVIDSGSW